ncbi:class I SAM-dependent methyltransferase [Mycolicibacterium llatzerense]|uniref:class I SAM-dependent methyltransferase n=1 Tax=Mycolicibacterium llatzerense TaxID=280871 RepID=UPI0021B5D8A1|nr:class I SAM-dependent methyltransferase [Mycolicibacterium llatzerense]MCT7364167.1 ubiquinone/menaquinone biosynthesis protein [Mycolicibacterium llatzerense]
MYRQRDRADSFGGAARSYDQHRPRYPEPMLDELVGAGSVRVLDVGAGTGIASRQLIARGAELVALEPDPRMAEIAAEHRVPVEVATFEDWDDAGRTFDVVLFAQSFHWVDPAAALPKIRRLLAPGGRLALAWNRLFPVRPSRADFAEVYRDFLDAASPLVTATPTGGTGSGMDSDDVVTDLAAAGFAVQQLTYERGEQCSREQWLDLVFTYSNHLVLPADRAAELRARLGAVIGDGGVQVGGDTLLIVARPA